MARVKTTLIDQVLAALDQQELVELTQELVRIPSVTFHEEQVCRFMERWLIDRGIAVERQEVTPGRFNVIATLPGAEPGPTLLFNGHLDTVPPGDGWSVDPYAAVIRSGKIYGRGSTDMKGGVAAAAAVLVALKRSGAPFRGKVVLTAVVDEEETESGTATLVQSGLRADFAVVCEPTTLRVVTAHKGLVALELETAGVSAHASVPERGESALDKMRLILDLLDEYRTQLADRRHHMLGSPTVVVGTIRGGVASCMVPAACTIGVDRRMIPGEDEQQVLGEIDALLDRLQTRGLQPRPKVSVQVVARPIEEPVASDLVRALSAAGQEEGLSPEPTGWPAVSDGHLLAHGAAIPTVLFGPGDLQAQAHKPDESVPISDLVTAARVYARLTLQLLGRGNLH